MTISKNKVVSLTYVLRLDDAEGQLVEQTTTENPLTFLFGAGRMLPHFEAQINGKNEGEQFAFGIPSENAYGAVNEQAIVDMPIDAFVIDGKLATDLLQLGKVIPMRDQQGNTLRGKIVAITEQKVTVDFNHPMAGKNLHFTINILSIREATESEVAHGHAHGPDGHHHHH